MPKQLTSGSTPATELSVVNELLNTLHSLPDSGKEEAGTPLSHYVWVIRRNRWRILAFMALSVAATFVISERLTPMYEATTTIDVDRQSPAGVIGEDADRNSLNDADQFLSTQIKLIQSDEVLRPVAERYNLLALEHQLGSKPEEARAAQDAPVMLKKLHVTRPPNTYLLLISYRSPNAALSADVANAVANSYVQHTYSIRYESSNALSNYMEKQLEGLKAKMERSSAALAVFERELNVVNPEEKTSILSARLLQLNTDYTNAQSERVKMQAAYDSVKNGSPEAAQVSTQGESLRHLNERLTDAQEKLAEVGSHYGSAHPEFKKASAQVAQIQQAIADTRIKIAERVEIEYSEAVNRENMMRRAVAATKSEFDQLNAKSFEYQAAKREADADKKLYEELVQKIKEASINTSFKNSSVRIAGAARPASRPLFPNIPLNVGIAALASLLAAFGIAILSDVLDSTIRSPEFITRELRTVVLGSLPIVKSLTGRVKRGAEAPGSERSLVKAAPAGEFEEAIRTLHSSILIGDLDRTLKSVMITSCASMEGKSTCAAHLAVAHASLGRKTLLIDGDLRRPVLHKRFGLSGTLGLSNALEGEMAWQELVCDTAVSPFLSILPAGPTTRRAPELVGRGLSKLLAEAAAEYDLVFLDGPPSSGFAEPLHMATAADGVIVITRAGHTESKALSALLGTLSRLRANVVGVVLNQVNRDVSNDYYAYRSYAYKYGENQT